MTGEGRCTAGLAQDGRDASGMSEFRIVRAGLARVARGSVAAFDRGFINRIRICVAGYLGVFSKLFYYWSYSLIRFRNFLFTCTHCVCV